MRRTIPCLLALAALAACRTPRSLYVHPNADLGGVKTVAVMPFENVTQERLAGDKVQKIFTAELLAAGPFEIVEPGLVRKALRDVHLDSASQMTAADMKKLGEVTGAQAIFLGSVLEYSDGRGGGAAGAPRVVLQVRLVEAASGTTIWSITDGRSGTSFTQRLFGVGGETPEEATQKLVRRELATLLR